MSGFKADPDPRRPALSPLAAQYAADLFDREMEQVYSQFVKKESEIITEFTNRGLQASSLCFNQLALNAIERARRTAHAKRDALVAAYQKDGAALDAETLAVIHGDALESFSEFQAQFLKDIQARMQRGGISHGTLTTSLIRSYRQRFIALAADLRRDQRIKVVETAASTEVEDVPQEEDVVIGEVDAISSPERSKTPLSPEEAILRTRAPDDQFEMLRSVLRRLQALPGEWVRAKTLDEIGLPSKTVFSAAPPDSYRGARGTPREYSKSWLVSFVSTKWSPKRRDEPSSRPDEPSDGSDRVSKRI